MKKIIILILLSSTSALADRDAFCSGFKEGYKSIKGNYALVPVCPIKPVKPINSTDFREGIKAGIKAASR